MQSTVLFDVEIFQSPTAVALNFKIEKAGLNVIVILARTARNIRTNIMSE
jgi:hypothetical protein